MSPTLQSRSRLQTLVEGKEESPAPGDGSQKDGSPQGDGVVLARLEARKAHGRGRGTRGTRRATAIAVAVHEDTIVS